MRGIKNVPEKLLASAFLPIDDEEDATFPIHICGDFLPPAIHIIFTAGKPYLLADDLSRHCKPRLRWLFDDCIHSICVLLGETHAFLHKPTSRNLLLTSVNFCTVLLMCFVFLWLWVLGYWLVGYPHLFILFYLIFIRNSLAWAWLCDCYLRIWG